MALVALAANAQTGLPVMKLSTAALQPVSVAAGANAASEVVQIENTGGGTLSPNVTSGATWLQPTLGASAPCAAPLVGTCIPLTIAFNTTSLAAGTYTAFISVADPNATDSPQTISATVTVIGFVSTTAITLYAAPNGGMTTTTINTHTLATAQASTATGGNWLGVALSLSGNASYLFYYPYKVTVTTQVGQGPGVYAGSIVFSGSNTPADNQTVPVTLNATTSPIGQLSASSLALVAGQGSQVSQVVRVSNIGQGALAVSGATATVSTGSGWLTAAVGSDGASITITADAAALQPGAYQGSVAVTSNSANDSALMIPVSFLVTQQSGPQIGFGGVVDNTGRSPIAPGDISSAYGTQFSTGDPVEATALPLPTSLGGVQVLVNGTAAPLYYTSAVQINFQLPYETAAGTATIQVSDNGTMGNIVSVPVSARAPEILLQPASDLPPIIVDYTTGEILTSGVAAHPGDTLVVYAIGLGQTNPAAVTGVGANTSPLQYVDGPVTIMLGGGFGQSAQVQPDFVGLAPGFAGLYQINFVIPQGFTSAAPVPMTLNVQGTISHIVNITIQ